MASLRSWESCSFQQVDGTGQHTACALHDPKIGVVGALGLVHVHDFDEAVDVWQFHIARGVRRWVRWIVALRKVALVLANLLPLNRVSPKLLIELILERDGLAAVGLRARR